MAKTIIGIFPDNITAEHAVDALLQYGYRNDEVSVISQNGEKFGYYHPQEDTLGRNSANGLLAGALVGTAIGVMAGFAAYYLFGVNLGGLLQATGIEGLASTVLPAALAGALLGGVIGYFTGFGEKKEDYRSYSYDGMRRYGEILVAVPASDSEEPEVSQILKEYGVDRLESINLNEHVESEFKPEYNSGFKRFDPYTFSGVKGGRAERANVKAREEEEPVSDLD